MKAGSCSARCDDLWPPVGLRLSQGPRNPGQPASTRPATDNRSSPIFRPGFRRHECSADVDPRAGRPGRADTSLRSLRPRRAIHPPTDIREREREPYAPLSLAQLTDVVFRMRLARQGCHAVATGVDRGRRGAPALPSAYKTRLNRSACPRAARGGGTRPGRVG
jgi:hypothetical protein